MPAKQNNQNSLKHGGESALVALQKGLPFADYLQETYHSILSQMGLSESDLIGNDGMIAKEIARQLTCSELFWQAMTAAAADGNLDQFEKYARRFGWLSSKSVKHLTDYHKLLQSDDSIDYESILQSEGTE